MKSWQFDHHFDSLKNAFKVMAQEVASLQRERDEYRTKVETQAKRLWDVRHSNICDRCSKEFHRVAGPSHSGVVKTVSSSSSRPGFPSKSLENSDTSRGLIPSPITIHRQIQSRTPIRKPTQPISHTKSRIVSNTTRAQTISLPPPSLMPSTSAVRPAKDRDWSITFNKKQSLNLEIVHATRHERFISHLKFSQDGKYLAVACFNGKAYIYDVQMGTVSCVLRDPLADDRKITAVCFSHDGNYLATASYESYVYIWEIKTKCVRNAFKGKTRFVHSINFSPNGRSLVSVSPDNTVRLWKMRDGTSKVLTDDDPKFLHENNSSFTSAVFSPNGRYVAASHEDGLVRIWNERAGQLVWRVKAHSDLVLCVAFMPDGMGLVSGGMDKMLRRWDISSLDATRPRARRSDKRRDFLGVEVKTQPVDEFSGHEDSVYSLGISPDGRWLASASFDRNVCVWDTQNAAMQCMLEGSWNAGNAAPCTLDGCWGSLSVDISPAGRYLASSNRDSLVTIWRYTEV